MHDMSVSLHPPRYSRYDLARYCFESLAAKLRMFLGWKEWSITSWRKNRAVRLRQLQQTQGGRVLDRQCPTVETRFPRGFTTDLLSCLLSSHRASECDRQQLSGKIQLTGKWVSCTLTRYYIIHFERVYVCFTFF